MAALKPGRLYHFCTCAQSTKLPWCDGTHKLATPVVKRPVKLRVDEPTRRVMCCCGGTDLAAGECGCAAGDALREEHGLPARS